MPLESQGDGRGLSGRYEMTDEAKIKEQVISSATLKWGEYRNSQLADGEVGHYG